MLQQAFCFCIPIFFLMFSILSESTTNSNIYIQCSQLYFNSMTRYESNINSLFTSLVYSSSIYNFNNFQISPPGYSQNDVVYGLFQCRGDLKASNCKECVSSSVSQLKTNCPVSTGGEIQLDKCFVKYDNSSFFGTQDKMEIFKRCGPSVGYNSDVLNRIDTALAYLVSGNGQYFRSGDDGSIKGVAQCVQDLSVGDCQDCLSEACGRLRSECETSSWGDMYLGKCYVKYVDQGDVNHEYTGGRSIARIAKWVAIIIGILVGGGGLIYTANVYIKNCCNTNYFMRNANKKVDDTVKMAHDNVKDVVKKTNDAVKDVVIKAHDNVIDVVKKTDDAVKDVVKKADNAVKKADDAVKKADDAVKRADDMKYVPYVIYGMHPCERYDAYPVQCQNSGTCRIL